MPKLVEAVRCAEVISERFNIPLYDLVDVFADVPSVTVAPPQYGEWLRSKNERICSNCSFNYFGNKDFDYCPECGAKMSPSRAIYHTSNSPLCEADKS